MRLLADENLPRPSIRLLRKAGQDIEAVAELGAGMPDMQVLTHARAQERVLVTFDRDFGDLIYRQGAPAPAGVVYLRFVPTSSEEPGQVLLQLLALTDVELIGRFTVVERERIRQRPLLRTT